MIMSRKKKVRATASDSGDLIVDQVTYDLTVDSVACHLIVDASEQQIAGKISALDATDKYFSREELAPEEPASISSRSVVTVLAWRNIIVPQATGCTVATMRKPRISGGMALSEAVDRTSLSGSVQAGQGGSIGAVETGDAIDIEALIGNGPVMNYIMTDGTRRYMVVVTEILDGKG